MSKALKIVLYAAAAVILILAAGGGGYWLSSRSVSATDAQPRSFIQPARIIYRSIELPALPPVPRVPEGAEKRIEGIILSDVPFGPPLSPRPPPDTRKTKAGEGAGKIVIIIDDMGMDIPHSKAIIALPGPLTLSFLPYAPRVKALTGEAKAKGHELMIHMPMQPISPDHDLGSIALTEGMSGTEFDTMMDKAFASFDGYIGLNNHMGSLLTQDRAAMRRLMILLKKHGLLFVDSRTSPRSVAADEARAAGVSYTSRDVFLDDDESESAVMKSLMQVEHVARKSGLAVAIGHPKAGTLAALKKWLPTLKDKGLKLITVHEAVKNEMVK